MYFDETQQKLASGTGFVYERNNKLYLITNWHNVTGLNPITKKQAGDHGGIPDVIVLTLQTQKEPFINWEHFPINLYDDDRKADWVVDSEHKERTKDDKEYINALKERANHHKTHKISNP